MVMLMWFMDIVIIDSLYILLWSLFFSTWSSGDKATEDKDNTLNIFSVASGHLYERLLRYVSGHP